MVCARPLTILFLLPVADRDWVTPNRITFASVATKLIGVAMLLLYPGYWWGVAAALLVNLGLILDNMDGTLARYRDSSSYLGYYMDKALDNVCLAALFVAIALRTFWKTGNEWDLALPLIGYAGASVAAYTKWVASKVETDMELVGRLKGGTLEEFAKRRAQQNPVIPPPERSLGDWMRFLFDAVKSILLFNEVDIFFFFLLAVVLDMDWIFTQVMSPLYALGMVIGPALFFVQLRKSARKWGLN